MNKYTKRRQIDPGGWHFAQDAEGEKCCDSGEEEISAKWQMDCTSGFLRWVKVCFVDISEGILGYLDKTSKNRRQFNKMTWK